MSNKINEGDFSIKKENKKDFKKTIISRLNLTNEFTIEDIEEHKANLEKAIKTAVSQINLSKGVVGNVERNHPFVSKMSDEQLAAASYLFEAKQVLAKTEKGLKDYRATVKKYNETLAVIYAKFGFIESNVMNDEEPQ